MKRHKGYITDTQVSTKSAHYKDYTRSGYTRGHLAPAGDMAFNDIAMKETFYMSNITPQVKQFNNGIWKELEESVRDWAYANDHLYIVTGPLTHNINKRIGKNKVGVPSEYYKVVLDNSGRERKAIGFIIPNEMSNDPLSKYAVTVDEVESITGLDFYHDVIESDEEEIEQSYDLSKWKMSDKRYKLRINKWNKE